MSSAPRPLLPTDPMNTARSSPGYALVRVRGGTDDPPAAQDDDSPADARTASESLLSARRLPTLSISAHGAKLKDTIARLRLGRWRLISTFTGSLLLLMVCAYMLAPPTAPAPAPASDKEKNQPLPNSPPSNPNPRHVPKPHYQLSPEEEAMFGQYQAVGLGNETLDEAYAPVPRKYVAPPNGDIYSTFGIVMASYSPHALMLSRFFDSMAQFCLDCGRIRFVVVIPSTEVDLFDRIRSDHIENLPLLEFVPYTQVFPALNDTLAANTPGWPKGWTGWDEERFFNKTDRSLFQSFKKVYGCLYLAREYCMFLDSEGIFIRPATFAELYGGFRKSPHVVYSSYLRHRYFATQTAQKLLGYHENWGWALEEYNWFMDTNIVAHLERLFRDKFAKLEQMEPLIFIEVVYWVYMMHNRHRYPRLRILDTANLFGIDVLEHMRKMANYDDIWYTPWEDLRWYMEKDPKLVDVAVDVFNENKFRIFKTGKTNESIALLERAPSIVLCVSEQPDNVFEMAMKGHFAKFLGPQDGPEENESE